MGDHPLTAIKSKPNSSLVAAISLVKQGKAGAIVSAGNSGALMLGATVMLGRQEGVERPAIAGFIPSIKDGVLGVDLGANVECKPHHLLEFAQLGIAHLQTVRGIKNPRVGLLCNGSEPGKGNGLIKDAHLLLLKNLTNFAGNVEPSDVYAHKIDLVVCDGYSGNIFLKALEGMAEFAYQYLASALAEVPTASEPLNAFWQKTDWAFGKIRAENEHLKSGRLQFRWIQTARSR